MDPMRWWRIAFFAFAVFGPLWYSFLDSEPPYEIVFGSVQPPLPNPGERVAIIWSVKINRTCRPVTRPGINTRRIVDSKNVIWDFAEPPETVGTPGPDISNPERTTLRHGIIERHLDLPAGLSRGPARYSSTACFICDPFTLQRFWPVCIKKPDLRFRIGRE